MKHAIRTVTWRFKESAELRLDFKNIKSVRLTSSTVLFKNYKSLFTNQVKERFVVFWLDDINNVLGFEIVSEGTLNASIVHPREVFRGAIIATAATIIVAHNHPSGGLEASQKDIEITKQLVESGKILGIPVCDHVIFAGNTYMSFAKRGLI